MMFTTAHGDSRVRTPPLLSTMVVYHCAYDMVVLVFALFYLFVQSRAQLRDPTVILFALCVLLIWFVEKPIFLLQTRSDSPLAQGVVNAYQWLIVAVVYTTLICGFVAVYVRHKRPSERGGLPC